MHIEKAEGSIVDDYPVAFNSLFEMLSQATFNTGRPNIVLSILYLRCISLHALSYDSTTFLVFQFSI